MKALRMHAFFPKHELDRCAFISFCCLFQNTEVFIWGGGLKAEFYLSYKVLETNHIEDKLYTGFAGGWGGGLFAEFK